MKTEKKDELVESVFGLNRWHLVFLKILSGGEEMTQYMVWKIANMAGMCASYPTVKKFLWELTLSGLVSYRKEKVRYKNWLPRCFFQITEKGEKILGEYEARVRK